DIDSPIGALNVSGSSSDTALVPNANVVIGGSGASRTVTVTPAANANGATTITLSVTDGLLTKTTSFLVTVTPVDDAPSITSVADQTIADDALSLHDALPIWDIDSPIGALNVSGSSSDTALVPNANVVIGGSGASRTVT